MAGGNKSYFHINAAATTQPISANAGAILGAVAINTAAGVASVLSIFDAATAAQCTAANTVAVINVQNANVPGYDYNVTMSRGIFYTLSAGTPDITITFD